MKFYIRMKEAEKTMKVCLKAYLKAKKEYMKARDIWRRHTPSYELEARRKKGKTK